MIEISPSSEESSSDEGLVVVLASMTLLSRDKTSKANPSSLACAEDTSCVWICLRSATVLLSPSDSVYPLRDSF